MYKKPMVNTGSTKDFENLVAQKKWEENIKIRNKYYDICNNCGKQGHTFKQCKNPITSFGVIIFRINQNQRQYLMIRRKDTLGYIDFMRGKYSVSNHNYILNMLKQMTVYEKHKLATCTFDDLWRELWSDKGLLGTENSSLLTSETKVGDPKMGVTDQTRPATKSPAELVVKRLSAHCRVSSEDASVPSILLPNSSGDLRSPSELVVRRHSALLPESQNPYIYTLFPTHDKTQISTTEGQEGFDRINLDVRRVVTSVSNDTVNTNNSYRQEETNSRDKFLYLSTKLIGNNSRGSIDSSNSSGDRRSPDITMKQSILQYLLTISNIPDKWKGYADPVPPEGGGWLEPEWGFPKGRRNYQEKDYECALREMMEETGYSPNNVKNIKNIIPFDEIFLGSNYKSYKHRYYLMYMNYHDSLSMDNFEKSEVSCMEWKSYDECMKSIRSYNLEKKRLITNIEHTLSKYRLFFHPNTM
jgi:8-oxo-dGTP pyrophosphatase MutT (NUDIX family)